MCGGELDFVCIGGGVRGWIVWIILMTGAVVGVIGVLLHVGQTVLIIIKALIFASAFIYQL